MVASERRERAGWTIVLCAHPLLPPSLRPPSGSCLENAGKKEEEERKKNVTPLFGGILKPKETFDGSIGQEGRSFALQQGSIGTSDKTRLLARLPPFLQILASFLIHLSIRSIRRSMLDILNVRVQV